MSHRAQQEAFNPAPPRTVAVEVAPPDPVQTDDVFLTPRVVDETAFDRFAGDLRSLIQDAATAGRALVRTGSETDRHLTAMREAAGELRTQTETGARLIPTIDQRIRRIDEALAKAEDRAALEDKITEHINQIIDDRIGTATKKAAEVAGRMGSAIEKASELARAITTRIDSATQAATTTADRIEDLAARLEAQTERAEKLIELAGTTTDEGEQRLGTALTEAEVASQQLSATIADVTKQIAPNIEAARDLVAEAHKTANDPALTEAVKVGESAKRTLLRAIREAKSIVEQTDIARRQLADDLETAMDKIDAVSDPVPHASVAITPASTPDTTRPSAPQAVIKDQSNGPVSADEGDDGPIRFRRADA
ncbi:MAG: hypothetical protein AAF297_01370 [Planctomycetota bacterium]